MGDSETLQPGGFTEKLELFAKISAGFVVLTNSTT